MVEISKPLSATKTKVTNSTSNFVSVILKSLNDPKNTFKNDEVSERSLENMVFQDSEFNYSANSTKFISGGINIDILSPLLNKTIINITDTINRYINNLINQQMEVLNNKKNANKFYDILVAKIITSNDVSSLFNICVSNFLAIYTYQDTDEDKFLASINVSINIGKKIFNKYLNNLKTQYYKSSGIDITFTNWVNKWKQDNEDFAKFYHDDDIYSRLGLNILTILTHSDLIEIRLTKSPNKIHRHYSLFVKDDKLMSSNNRRSIINLPVKLPMVCPPRPYDKDILGGYLLNDDKFSEDLLINKRAYAKCSELSGDKIYNMVNNISKTPFKINKNLLDYIYNEGSKHNLLIDPEVRHEFEDLDKRNKHPKGVLASYKSKIILQQTILGIADFYSAFSNIYFPVRLDKRGRLYCSPSYLNYQSKELSKALVLFSEPGFVDRNDSIAILYLKVYGANCFGGNISRTSISEKGKWVDNNIKDIVNYDNGILLKKAEDKLLFLAFCMEYKRFQEFYLNTTFMGFKTSLPIQLDATCNAFQHMALLSNENTLFKELNLIPERNVKGKKKDTASIDNRPSDFYNFLLHRLISYFKSKVDRGIFLDYKTTKNKEDKDKGSFMRLYSFVWNRVHVKKSIMTIPYNSSHRSMMKYLSESLVRSDCDKDGYNWYCTNEKDNKNLINQQDLYLLISSLQYIIKNDFQKIKKQSILRRWLSYLIS